MPRFKVERVDSRGAQQAHVDDAHAVLSGCMRGGISGDQQRARRGRVSLDECSGTGFETTLARQLECGRARGGGRVSHASLRVQRALERQVFRSAQRDRTGGARNLPALKAARHTRARHIDAARGTADVDVSAARDVDETAGIREQIERAAREHLALQQPCIVRSQQRDTCEIETGASP